jgi:hypothetical protein
MSDAPGSMLLVEIKIISRAVPDPVEVACVGALRKPMRRNKR